MPHCGSLGVFATSISVFTKILPLETIPSVILGASLAPILPISALTVHLGKLTEAMEDNVSRNVLSVICLMRIVLVTIYARWMNQRHFNSTSPIKTSISL